MAAVSAVFWDVGGVVLSNAWDRVQRRAVLERFGVDEAEFERRHAAVVADFETGRLPLQGYLEATVFFRRRPFSRARFSAAMRAQSRPFAPALALARRLRRAGRCLCASLNNESRELNEHRIRRFRLREAFDVFFSSCYLGARKPEPDIFLKALALTRRAPRECLFVDDRGENIEAARALGLRAHLYRGVDGFHEELGRLRLI